MDIMLFIHIDSNGAMKRNVKMDRIPTVEELDFINETYDHFNGMVEDMIRIADVGMGKREDRLLDL